MAAGRIDADDVPELLWSLADKSLVTPDLTSSATRYRLLESVQESPAAGSATTGRRARPRCASPPGTASGSVRSGGTPRRGSGRSGWRSTTSGRSSTSWHQRNLPWPRRLAFTIARYHDAMQSFQEGIAELRQDMELLSAPTPAAISLRTTLADLHLRLGQATEAKLALADAEALHHEVGALPEWDDAAIERTRGELACQAGDYSTASTPPPVRWLAT